jgi:hypothetical protein
MSTIPVDLERKFEQRWAARFARPIPPAPFERPACPRCKARMMLVSIEPERPGVDLDTFQCAVCNHVLTTLAAHEDPMHSQALGRWLLGDLPPPR